MTEARSHVFPNVKSVSVGEDAVFICNAFGSVQWYFNAGQLPTNSFYEVNHETTSHTLTITNVTIYNSGTYSCVGEHLQTHFSEDVQLIVSSNNVHHTILMNIMCTP